LDV
jgi:hypothetical protein